MKKLSVFLLFFVLLGFSSYASSQERKTGELRVTSPVIGKEIPRKYACDGENINPPLEIRNVPPQAKSLALILDDLDAPRGSFVHWILWNIDPRIGELQENSIPTGAVQGTNDFKKQSYGGPCPPSRAHRYVFRVFALDTRLLLGSDSAKVDLQKAFQGHVIAEGQMIFRYKRK